MWDLIGFLLDTFYVVIIKSYQALPIKHRYSAPSHYLNRWWPRSPSNFALQSQDELNHWGRETHICVSKLTIIGSDNGLSPGRRQAIIWTNAGILLIRTFSEILIEIGAVSFKKMHLKMSSTKWRPFCLGINVLTTHLPWAGGSVWRLTDPLVDSNDTSVRPLTESGHKSYGTDSVKGQTHVDLCAQCAIAQTYTSPACWFVNLFQYSGHISLMIQSHVKNSHSEPMSSNKKQTNNL